MLDLILFLVSYVNLDIYFDPLTIKYIILVSQLFKMYHFSHFHPLVTSLATNFLDFLILCRRKELKWYILKSWETNTKLFKIMGSKGNLVLTYRTKRVLCKKFIIFLLKIEKSTFFVFLNFFKFLFWKLKKMRKTNFLFFKIKKWVLFLFYFLKK